MCTLLYVGTRPSILCQIQSEQSGGHTTSHVSSGLTVLLARGWSLKAQCLEPEGQTEGIANGNIANRNITDGQMGFHRRPLIFTYEGVFGFHGNFQRGFSLHYRQAKARAVCLRGL